MVKYATMMLDFIKTDVFKGRKQVSVEEVVTLIAALTDISVTLLSKFRKDEVDPSKATEVGRDVFRYLVGRLGFDVDHLAGKSNINVRFRTSLDPHCRRVPGHSLNKARAGRVDTMCDTCGCSSEQEDKSSDEEA